MTPMMRQYLDIKSEHPDTLLLYRLGDFYEMFNEDAVTAARILGLTLTARNHGGKDPTPLAGFPYHAIERYLPKLIGAGLRVAVCEQTEDPAQAKGVVKREVTEIVTRGTALSDQYLEAKSNNWLAAVCPGTDEKMGLSTLDLSTGAFQVAEGTPDQVADEVYRLGVQEILYPEAEALPAALAEYQVGEKVPATALPKGFYQYDEGVARLERHFKVASLEAFDCAHWPLGLRAAAAALAYAQETKRSDLGHLVKLEPTRFENHMALDAATIRNLEILRPLHGDDEEGTLFALMDRTSTALGARCLKRWLTHPLLDRAAIAERQDAVAELIAKPDLRKALRHHLQGINDIERIVARCGAARAHARDLLGLSQSLTEAASAAALLSACEAPAWKRASEALAPWGEFAAGLAAQLTDKPPLTVREGGMIRPGAFPELDALVDGIRDGREWLNGLQERERAATGISTLKVGYNKVFGYFLEVTKAQENKVPAHYLRKQSLVNAERYITPEMKEWENRILSAESEINGLEYRLFCSLRDGVNAKAADLLAAAARVAEADALQSLAQAAEDLRWTRPEIAEEPVLRILGGRHPVVESLAEPGNYIANDVELDARARQILLVTGPNMAGKSTYLRQIGLVALLAQIGSCVPAEHAMVGLCDRIFTRVGASDRLAKGQSTFMVEMIETANILRHATPRSLVLLDEIGRGTSTYDGLSLAWAIVEALHQEPARAARTLFATHYHEITQLEGRLERLRNVQVTVRETGGQVVFLRKVVEGACDSSYGIQVARMAGVPESVVRRAGDILHDLEEGKAPGGSTARRMRPKPNTAQVDLFSAPSDPVMVENPLHREAFETLQGMDLNQMTPLEVLFKVGEWQKRTRK